MLVLRYYVMVIFAIVSAIVCAPVSAQSQYPSRLIQLVVPYGSGGSSDLMGRLSAVCMSARFKQPVVVLNKPGANAEIGGKFVSNASPDGYTLLLSSSATVTDLVTKRSPTFDVRKDLAPITKLGFGIQGIFVNVDLPAKTVSEFIAYAKANAGKINYASAGIGSVNQLSTEALALNAGLNMVHIPYEQGTAALLTGLMRGDVQLVLTSYTSAQSALKTGKIRLLGVLEKERSPTRPNLPTVVETVPGMASFVGTLWYGFFAPPKTSTDVIAKAHAEIAGCLKNDATLRSALREMGYEDTQIIADTPQHFADSIQNEINQLRDLVKRANIPLL